MAHYAKVKNKKVIQVIVADSEYIENLKDTSPGKWIQTSYNTHGGVHINGGTPLRKNYAVIDGNYCPVKDAFYDKQPHTSWTLNEDTYLWEAPVAYPDDGNMYTWNEETTSWVEVNVN